MKDEKLLALLKRDPEAGMTKLVDEYGGLVMAVVRGKLSGTRFCEADMEDCAAETFADIFARVDSLDLNEAGLKGRLCVIAKRKALDKLRLFYRESANTPLTPELAASVPAPGAVEDTLTEAGNKRELIAAVKALGRPDSEILIRKYFLGQSSKQIAEALGLSAANVDTRTHRAVKKLKESLGGEYDE